METGPTIQVRTKQELTLLVCAKILGVESSGDHITYNAPDSRFAIDVRVSSGGESTYAHTTVVVRENFAELYRVDFSNATPFGVLIPSLRAVHEQVKGTSK